MLWARVRKRALSWGAIEVQVNGGRAAHGAISAAGAELLAPQIASILYGKSEADLTPDEKADVISMASLAGGIAGALMNGKSEGVEIIGNTAINAQIAENTVTNNYLSGWQEKQRDEEFAACNGSLRCELKTGVYWELVSAGQDTAYGAGLAASIPVGIFETVKGLAEIAVHPIDSLNAIKTLIQEGNFTEAMKQSYANRIDKMIVEYEKAGAEGAFKAGLETGQLLQETVGILAGGAGLAKVGAKFTKAVVTFAKGEKTAVAVVKGSASSTASDIASNTLETVKNSRVKALTCSFRGDMEVKTEQGYKPIESIKIGDKVYAKNELTGQMTYQRVQAHYNNPYDFTVYVEVIDEQGKHQTIVSNKIHPFFTQVNQGELVPSSEGHHYKGEIQNAQWVDAQNLKAGYKLLSENNHWQTVKGVTIKAEKLSAYNLTVETDHTYFIKGANSDVGGVWVHNNCWNSLPADAVNTGKTTPDGRALYTFKDNTGKQVTAYKGKDERYYDPKVYPPEKVDAVNAKAIDNNAMLGANGTKIFSSTVWKENGSKARIDIENPSPGKRPGQIHYQDQNNIKYYYNPKDDKFYVGKISDGKVAPKNIQELLNNPDFRRGIDKGLNYLGEKK